MSKDLTKIHSTILSPSKAVVDQDKKEFSRKMLEEISTNRGSGELKNAVSWGLKNWVGRNFRGDPVAVGNLVDILRREMHLTDHFLRYLKEDLPDFQTCSHFEVRVLLPPEEEGSFIKRRKLDVSLHYGNQKSPRFNLTEPPSNINFFCNFEKLKGTKLKMKFWKNPKCVLYHCDFEVEEGKVTATIFTEHFTAQGTMPIQLTFCNKDKPSLESIVTAAIVNNVSDCLDEFFMAEVVDDGKGEVEHALYLEISNVGFDVNIQHNDNASTIMTAPGGNIRLPLKSLVDDFVKISAVNESQLEEKPRRRSILVDTIDAAVNAGRRISGKRTSGFDLLKTPESPTEKTNISIIVKTQEISWKDGLEVEMRGYVKVKARVTTLGPRFDNEVAKKLLQVLYFDKMRSEAKKGRLNDWVGNLPVKSTNLIHMLQTFFTPNEWKLMESQVLLELQSYFVDINEGLLHSCITNIVKLGNGISPEMLSFDKILYRKCCLQTLSCFEARNFVREPDKWRKKIQWIIKTLRLMYRDLDENDLFFDLRFNIEQTLDLKIFQKLDLTLEDLLNDLLSSINPSLRIIKCEFVDFPVWYKSLSESAAEKSFQFIELRMKPIFSGKCDDTRVHYTTYQLYTALSELLEDSNNEKLTSRFYDIFRPCLPKWTEVAADSAKECVNRVLEMERNGEHNHGIRWKSNMKKKQHFRSVLRKMVRYHPHEETNHAQCSHAPLQAFSSMDAIEAAINVDGVFSSCAVTWETLKWPDPKESIKFGMMLRAKLSDVFRYYAKEFHQMAIQDEIFEPSELVVAIKSIFYSSNYIQEFNNLLIEEVKRLPEGSFVVDKVDVKQDENIMMAIITSFCEGQRKYFKTLLAIEYDAHHAAESKDYESILYGEMCHMTDTETDHTLSEGENEDEEVSVNAFSLLRGMLIYFRNNLKLRSTELTEKCHDLLKRKLFEVQEQEIDNFYKKYCKKSDHRQYLHDLKGVVNSTIELRKSKKLEESKVLAKLQSYLELKGIPTQQIMAKCLALDMAERNESLHETFDGVSKEDKPMGTLRFKCVMLNLNNGDKEVLVSLKSVKDLKPRLGLTTCNFSLAIAVLPVFNSKGYLKDTTVVYHNRLHHVFDLVDEDKIGVEPQSEYVLTLTPEMCRQSRCDPNKYLQISLSYHPIITVDQKHFIGDILIPLNTVSVRNVQELDNDERFEFSLDFHHPKNRINPTTTKYLTELFSRKHDDAAKRFCKRYEFTPPKSS